MTNSRLIYDELKIRRKSPINIDDKNEKLFHNSYTGISKETRINYFDQVTINNELFIKDGLKFLILPESFGDIWQDKVFNAPTYLLKSFAKNLIRNNIKYDTVLWCFDLFSTGGYFHWLTEICPRLWIANNHIDPTIPLAIPEYFLTKWKFAEDLLKPFNRRIITFKENELLNIKKLVFIGQPGGPLNYQPVSISHTATYLKAYYYDPNYPTSDPKIYISRKKAGKRMVLNEAEVIDLITPYGYKVLYLEDLSIYDQINLFSRANNLLSVHGAGLTNMIYLNSGSKVIEIRHLQENHVLNCFYTLSHTFGHKYYYCLGYEKGDSLLTELRPEDKSIHADLIMLKGILDNIENSVT